MNLDFNFSSGPAGKEVGLALTNWKPLGGIDTWLKAFFYW
jgi:hypothetical protein